MRNRKRMHRVEVAMNDHEYKKFLESVERCGMTKQAYLLFLINNLESLAIISIKSVLLLIVQEALMK